MYHSRTSFDRNSISASNLSLSALSTTSTTTAVQALCPEVGRTFLWSRRAFMRLDLPSPVAPTIAITVLGSFWSSMRSSSSLYCEKQLDINARKPDFCCMRKTKAQTSIRGQKYFNIALVLQDE